MIPENVWIFEAQIPEAGWINVNMEKYGDGFIIKAENVKYVYKAHYDDGRQDVVALSKIDLTVRKGEFVVILGRNGSGKSTLARLMNALLLPTKGIVYIKGLNTSDEDKIWEIRRSTGMVFQNPDNQIVGTTVEEDVAFGPENIGIFPAEIRKRVDEALETVGIPDYAKHAPHLLSGGQKQKVAIAGILAMKPECIVLDEATSMLDPSGRKEVMAIIRKLNKTEKITVIHITHNMDEANMADRVVIIDKGSIVMQGSPGEVFSDVAGVKKLGLDVPQVTELFYELNREGFELPQGVLGVDEACKVLCKALGGRLEL